MTQPCPFPSLVQVKFHMPLQLGEYLSVLVINIRIQLQLKLQNRSQQWNTTMVAHAKKRTVTERLPTLKSRYSRSY